MAEDDDDPPVPERSEIYRRYEQAMEARELAALRRALRASGWDLRGSDGDDERAFTEFLAEGRRRQESRIRRGKLFTAGWHWVAAAIGGVLVSKYGSDVVSWLSSRLLGR